AVFAGLGGPAEEFSLPRRRGRPRGGGLGAGAACGVNAVPFPRAALGLRKSDAAAPAGGPKQHGGVGGGGERGRARGGAAGGGETVSGGSGGKRGGHATGWVGRVRGYRHRRRATPWTSSPTSAFRPPPSATRVRASPPSASASRNGADSTAMPSSPSMPTR